MRALFPILLLTSPLPAQDGGVIATFELAGERVPVMRHEVVVDLALHFRRRPEGAEARDHLIDTWLVRLEAREQGVEPDEEEIARIWKEIEERFARAGRDLEELLRERGTSREDYREELALSIAHRRLTMRALELTDPEEVTGAMQELWLKDARKRHEIVTDPERLAPQVVARVDDHTIGLRELGRLLLKTSSREDQERFVRQIAARRILQHRAEKAGIEVTREDLEEAYRERKERAEQDPRWQGVPFEDLLKTQGHTRESLLASPAFRANVLLRELVRREWPDERLQRRLEEHRAEVLRAHGARRRIAIVFVRALEEPNELVPRDFDEAHEHLADLRTQIVEEGRDFAELVKLHSEHHESRVQGGDTGWHHRTSDELPPPVLDAAFDMPGDRTVSRPIRADDGGYLVKVLDVEPPPDTATILRRMRRERIGRYTAEMLEEAGIEMK